ncbi:MAG: GUN4 domain-containing protein, partial [Coleofasciculus sp. Co-bin14]|nr:GUN4 domain-containing protein [Coleofasciculus sp. Co-bin14]
RDYLIPCDGNPRDVEYTAISISYVTERLLRCGADNVVLLLDACRNEGEKAGLGIGLEKQQGVITICSCSPREKSYEIEQIGQGAFTYTLLESLRIQGEGNCATVERLYQRLRYRVAEINRDYNKPEQTPYAIVEPASKYHLILLPRQATLQDIALLKMDALKAEVAGDYELAKQLWIRVNAAAAGSDIDVIQAFQRIFQHQEQPTPPAQTEPVTNQSGARSQATPLKAIEPEVELLFEKNVDYTRLRDLLADGKWKEADEETLAVMLKAAGREKEGKLDRKSMERFPCADLRTIDRLWVKYSDGRFGFSVQKRIWESVGGKPGGYVMGIYSEFGDRVGWSVKGKWLNYPEEYSFSLNAPDGHLPHGIWGWDGSRGGGYISSLASRLVMCNI